MVEGEPIRFSTSAAARSSPERSMGGGQENPVAGRLLGIVALGCVLVGSMLYSIVTDEVDLAAPPIPDILRKLDPASASGDKKT